MCEIIKNARLRKKFCCNNRGVQSSNNFVCLCSDCWLCSAKCSVQTHHQQCSVCCYSTGTVGEYLLQCQAEAVVTVELSNLQSTGKAPDIGLDKVKGMGQCRCLDFDVYIIVPCGMHSRMIMQLCVRQYACCATVCFTTFALNYGLHKMQCSGMFCAVVCGMDDLLAELQRF